MQLRSCLLRGRRKRIVSVEDLLLHPYSYELALERIAQRPVRPPHDARMLVVDKKSGGLSNSTFLELPEFLCSSDLLVFNDSKVMPVRFFGRFENTEGELEVLLLREIEVGKWRCLGKPLRRFHAGRTIEFGAGLKARVGARVSEKEVELLFFQEDAQQDLAVLLGEQGLMPIPPYIRGGHADNDDKTDYQTIFAEKDGSIAAPTASLHFTDELMRRVKVKGCKIEFLTLHVGTASFLPLEQDSDGRYEPPTEERMCVGVGLLDRMEAARKRGGRVIGVGTTVIRALETAARGELGSGSTSLFIQPGFQFRAVDAVITNFHQPGTTHLLLLEALLGRELLDKSYQYALAEGYRFLSYGDGMLII